MSVGHRIGEFAELAGVSVKTLRFYDEIGVLSPASVDPRTGYRRYLPEQLKDLASVLMLKGLGLPLAQVRELNHRKSSPSQRKAMLQEMKRTLEQSIQTATRSLNWISAALEEEGASPVPISVLVKRRPATSIASVRIRPKSYQEVAEAEDELSKALPPECGCAFRGVLWHRCAGSGSLEAEPFIALRRPVPGWAGCTVSRLPEATLACAYSDPEDEAAEQTYEAIRRWLHLRGYRLAGPKRELSLGRMLEIQFPFVEN
ncbi:MerR family DNA-binding transcriptional regulator [Acidobacteria bacterium AB60]|nr:MerR family DNA-binding transcriptional regulator [Acidobacteria bacterium AB60]